MQKIQRQVSERLVDACPECGGEVSIVGNGPYRAPKCAACKWTLTAERAVELVKASDEFQVA